MSTLHHQPSPYLPLRGNVAEIAGRLDHTNLRPTSGKRDIEQLCKEAAKYAFGAVCVAPRWVKTAVDFLSAQGADSVKICTVIGFPHGNTTTEGKAFALGAEQIWQPGSYVFDHGLIIHSSVLSWLQSSRQGLFIIAPEMAFDALRDVPAVVAEYRKYGDAIKQMLKPKRLPKILVRRSVQEAA